MSTDIRMTMISIHLAEKQRVLLDFMISVKTVSPSPEAVANHVRFIFVELQKGLDCAHRLRYSAGYSQYVGVE